MKGRRMLVIILVIIVSLGFIEILALLKLKYSVTAYKNYWQAGTNATISSKDQLYIALGDSATQGVGAGTVSKGYVSLIATALATKSKTSVRTINLSVSGARVQDVISDQLPQLKDYPTDSKTIITLNIGGNDMRQFDKEKFAKEMQTLFGQLPKQTIIANVPYFGGGRYRKYEPNVLQANKIIEQLADTYGFTIVPLYEVTRQKDSLIVYSADYFHPSNSGYRNWFEAFRLTMNL